MEVLAPDKEVMEVIREVGGEALKTCFQCGSCSSTCPWNLVLVKEFIVRKMIRQAQLGVIALEEDERVWLCVSCGACVKRCPRGVKIIDIMKALRRIIVELGVGKVPESLALTIKNIQNTGNPLGESAKKRGDWAKELDLRPHKPGDEILYFPCCIPAYDPNAKKVALAMASIFKKSNVSFGILGDKEACCGESIRKVGDEDLFQKLVKANLNAFKEAGVKKVVTSSPHCYHVFKNEYPEAGFEVIHYTQYLADLIKQGKLKFRKELKIKVTYQDPCFLGRHNNIYDEPRKILKSIPGLELVEMRDSREFALCCGGGGGRIWQETKKEERFSDIRLKQAIETGASVLVVSCPYCLLNFQDSILTSEKKNCIEVKDLSELVLEAI